MKKVQVLMSTYNGEKYVSEQIESILKQDYPGVEILIRDDGSKDSTISILQNYRDEYPNINLIIGENIGVVSSFFELMLQASEDADFLAFCDQDDFWETQKISRAVSEMEKESQEQPLLYFSRLDLVDDNLHYIKQSPIPPRGASLENALIQNIATGCTIVFNRKLLETFISHFPNVEKVTMHDSWLYLVGTALGKVLYDEQSHLLYRQHSSNVLGMADNKLKSALIRYKKFKKEGQSKPYTVQAKEFYRLYQDQLNERQRKVIYDFLYNRKSFIQRVIYSLRTSLYRQNKRDTLIFKFLFSINKY